MSACRKKCPWGPPARAAPDEPAGNAEPALPVNAVTLSPVQSSRTGDPASAVTEQDL